MKSQTPHIVTPYGNVFRRSDGTYASEDQHKVEIYHFADRRNYHMHCTENADEVMKSKDRTALANAIAILGKHCPQKGIPQRERLNLQRS